MFENIIARNPNLNATLADGHALAGQIQAQRLGANPRLYANEVGGGMGRVGLVPETDSQDNSDLPDWNPLANDGLILNSNADGNNNPLPDDVAVYLDVWVAERQNFYDVAGVLRRVAAGATLDQALS